MHHASGSQQEREGRKEVIEKVEGEKWETVVGKRRKKEKREKEREADEGGSEQVEKDVTDWTVQIYLKVNGGKLVLTEVNLMDDKVENVVRQIPSSEDMYVTMQGRVLKRGEKLQSCGVADGCTIHATCRMRGGGRSKNKTAGERKKKSPKKVEHNDQSTVEKNLPEVDTIAEMLDRGSRTGGGGWSAEMIEVMLEIEDVQMEKMLGMLRSNLTEEVGGDPEMVIGGIKKFVRDRWRRREVQREEETGKAEEKQEKEVRTGRGNAGGGDERCRRNEASGKGKGKRSRRQG